MLPLNMHSSRKPKHQHHADKLIGVAMRSDGVVCALAFVLACLAAMPPASAASGDGGLLCIPSAASLAHCPSRCMWERQHLLPLRHRARLLPTRLRAYLQCNHTTQPPKLFLANSRTQITSMYGNGFVEAPMFFNVSSRSGTKNHSISWNAPS